MPRTLRKTALLGSGTALTTKSVTLTTGPCVLVLSPAKMKPTPVTLLKFCAAKEPTPIPKSPAELSNVVKEPELKLAHVIESPVTEAIPELVKLFDET